MLAKVKPCSVLMDEDGTRIPGPARNVRRRWGVVRYVAPTPDAITFYWRPGCGFCVGLERRLDRLGIPLDKRNIWEDADAAAVVRSIADGNETVPTVVVGDAGLVNPSADAVVAAVRSEAPHLEPDEPKSAIGVLDRIFGG